MNCAQDFERTLWLAAEMARRHGLKETYDSLVQVAHSLGLGEVVPDEAHSICLYQLLGQTLH